MGQFMLQWRQRFKCLAIKPQSLLYRHAIVVGDMVNKTEAELLACPNFGQTSLNEIKTKLDEFGLSLRG